VDTTDLSSDSASVISSFKAINLVTGLTAGVNSIVPGAMLSNNFDITYGLGHLTILPAELTVKALDTSFVYGATPAFRDSVSGFKYQDSAGSVISGTATYSLKDSSGNSVTGTPSAGNYKIVPGGLNLIAPANYSIHYVNGNLTISAAALIVKANDQVIPDDSLLPAFTSTITGFRNGDTVTIISGPVYIVNPVYQPGQPGTYTITPSALGLQNPSDYNISYLSGNLYVNPDDGSNIITKLDCVEKLVNDPSGFGYRAHFSYQNKNASALFIPVGPDNNITSAGTFSGQQPQLFVPGGGGFLINFDGSKMTWTVVSFQSGHSSASSSYASSTSSRCKGSVTNGITGLAAEGAATEETTTTGRFQAYPNPVRDWLQISLPDSVQVAANDVEVIDVYGKTYSVTVMPGNHHGLKLDLSTVSSGIYFIRVGSSGKGFKIFRILKL